MNVTLKQLHCFKAVAELSSFTRASQRLGMAQPALSLEVRRLELEMNVRLLDRTTRRVELTEAGREFLGSVDKLIGDLDGAIRGARDVTDRKRGKLVVGAPPLLAAMIAPAAIAEYKRLFPAIDIRLIDAQTDVLVEKVRSGQADCAIGTFADSEEGIRRVSLFEDELMLLCDVKSPFRRIQRVTWKDLAGSAIVTLTRESNIRTLIDGAYETAQLSLKPAFEVSHVSTAIMLVEAGLGASILPAYAWGFAKAFRVMSKPLSAPRVKRQVAFIYSSSRFLSPAADGFLGLIRKHALRALPTRTARIAVALGERDLYYCVMSLYD